MKQETKPKITLMERISNLEDFLDNISGFFFKIFIVFIIFVSTIIIIAIGISIIRDVFFS